MTDRRTFIKQLGIGGLALVAPITFGADNKPTATFSYSMELELDIKVFGLDPERELLAAMANELNTTPDQVVILNEWMVVDSHTFCPRRHVKITTK